MNFAQKQRLALVLSGFILLCLPLAAKAQLTYSTNGSSITITGYSGPGGSVVIPDTISGLPVTTIRTNSFTSCTNLTGITVPASITNIGALTFNRCTSLTNIIVNATNPTYSSLNGVLLDKNQTTLLQCPGGKTGGLQIPTNVTSIGSSACLSCSNLASVTIPDSDTSIGDSAFSSCTSLTNVTIGTGVTSIGTFAFRNCTSLTSILIPNSVTNIGSVPFYGSTSLTNVTIGTGVTSIGNSMFSSCPNLTSIIIPDSITSIGNSAFSTCSNLTSITIPNSVTNIGSYVFKYCTSLPYITIPNSVISMGSQTFHGCTSLTNIVIPDSITSIGAFMFYNCSNLTDVLIGNGVTNIGTYAFYNCTKLTNVNIPNNVTSIESQAFRNCTSLPNITIPDSVTNIGDYVFYDCSSLTRIAIPDSVSSIGTYAFYGCSALNNVIIGTSITDVANFAFAYCSSLTSINIPDSVSSIGIYAFSYCTSLTNIIVPDSVSSLGNYTFYGCSNLTSAVIGNGVPSIGDYVFYNCTKLAHAVIGTSVADIGTYAFYGCYGLMDITVDAANTTYISLNGVLFDQSQTTLIKYPAGKTGAYTVPNSATNIAAYAFYYCSNLSGVAIGNSVVSIGTYAFRNCTGLTNIFIPNSVSNIGTNAFYGCYTLQEITVDTANTTYNSLDGVLFNKAQTTLMLCPAGKTGLYTIPNGVTNIGTYAFYRCTKLTDVVVGNGVTKMGNYAFSYCSSLTHIAIPNSVDSIGTYTFYTCTNLADVVLGSGITNIGTYAFSYCSSLINIIVTDHVQSIGTYAFRSCTSLTNITIPASVTNIGSYAFRSCSNLLSVYFRGNASDIGENPGSAFLYATNTTVYYLPDTTGWGSTFGGRPTAPWGVPSITAQPANQSIPQDLTGSFTVSVFGIPPYSYQWSHDGLALPMATNNQFAITSCQPGDGGNYQVVITNKYGATTSSVATLVVVDDKGPTLTVNGISGQTVGQRIYTFSGTATDAARGGDGIANVWVNGILLINVSGTGNAVVPWSHAVTLQQSMNQISIVAADTLGNRTTNLFYAYYLPAERVSPTLAITPPPATTFSNALVVTGAASDSKGVAEVWCQHNTGPWMLANGTNRWSVTLTPVFGTNTLSAYAVDTSGNYSKISTVRFVKLATDVLPIIRMGNGRMSPDLNGLPLVVNKTYSTIATPVTGYLFSNCVATHGLNGPVLWTTNKPAIQFTMASNLVLVVNFAPNPYLARKGDYTGLFSPSNDVVLADWTNSGSVKLTVTDRGTFTGQLQYQGKVYPLAGALGLGGATNLTILRGRDPALQVSLALDLSNNGEVSGTIGQNQAWTSELWVSQVLKQAQKTNYTLTVETVLADTNHSPVVFTVQPSGLVTSTVQQVSITKIVLAVQPSGLVTLSGTLADKTKLTGSLSLTRNQEVAMCQTLYSGKGMWLGYVSLVGTNRGGEAHWQKLPSSLDKVNPNGFSVNTRLLLP